MPDTDIDVTADVADRLFDAIERSDVAVVEQLFSQDVAVWKSGDEAPNGHRRSLRVIAWFIDTTVRRRYEILDRQFFDGGFVQQHILHATGRSGVVIAPRVCIVIRVGADGLISRIDEYFDPALIAPLLPDGRS